MKLCQGATKETANGLQRFGDIIPCLERIAKHRAQPSPSNVILEVRTTVCNRWIGNQNFPNVVREFYGYGFAFSQLASVVVQFCQTKNVQRDALNGRFPVLNVNA